MELQCVEILGPDAASATFSRPNPSDNFTQTSLSTHVTRPHHDPLRSATHDPSARNILPHRSLSSPLTYTPTSSPKRRRISHAPTSFSTSNSSVPTSTPHPLSTLAERDLPYVIRDRAHLKDTTVTPDMREEVVAWCSDMTEDLQLSPAVVAIAINLFDRFLMLQTVSKTLLYPLTASCLLLACKVLMDEHVPCHEIASRSRVTVEDIRAMEPVVLNVLSWRVNVVTPHEVVSELCSTFEERFSCHKPLLECLLLNSLADYGLAWLRATSIGVACFVLCASVTQGEVVDVSSNLVIKLASDCGVDIEEVTYCINWLRDSMQALFSEVEQCDSE